MVRHVTNLLIGVALLLTLTWPFELRGRPTAQSPLAQRRAFASRLTLHTGGIVLCLVGAGVGAMLISRQAKRQYREASIRNLRTLIEGEATAEDGERS